MARAVVAKVAEIHSKNQIEQCTQKQIRLISTSIVQEIKNPIYLPVEASSLKDFYLIRGEWQEKWTYDVCGKPYSVIIDFQADGMGGAFYLIGMQKL